MHTDHDPIDPSVLADLGYEQRDVRPKPMVWAAFWLFAFTLGSGILAALFIRFWNIVPEVPVEQRAFHHVQPPAGTPILQNNSDNTADIAKLRSDEASVLNSSGALNDGFYHLTIDDAIKMISERGLPKTATLPVSRPTVTPQGTVINQVPAPPALNATTNTTKPKPTSPTPKLNNASPVAAQPTGAKKS